MTPPERNPHHYQISHRKRLDPKIEEQRINRNNVINQQISTEKQRKLKRDQDLLLHSPLSNIFEEIRLDNPLISDMSIEYNPDQTKIFLVWDKEEPDSSQISACKFISVESKFNGFLLEHSKIEPPCWNSKPIGEENMIEEISKAFLNAQRQSFFKYAPEWTQGDSNP